MLALRLQDPDLSLAMPFTTLARTRLLVITLLALDTALPAEQPVQLYICDEPHCSSMGELGEMIQEIMRLAG
jgi:hypothetical protein